MHLSLLTTFSPEYFALPTQYFKQVYVSGNKNPKSVIAFLISQFLPGSSKTPQGLEKKAMMQMVSKDNNYIIPFLNTLNYFVFLQNLDKKPVSELNVLFG